MSFTNKTPNYDLPQYIATDKPTYLVDANGAYLAIDTAMKANETAAATAQSTADTNTAAISTLNTQINGENGLAADLTAVETLAATTAGSVNTINSLIGNGEPTTTDKTLIGAINELNTDKASASDVSALETEVDGKVDKGGILKYTGTRTIEASFDGVKTYSAVLDEVYAALKTYIEAKSATTYKYRVVTCNPNSGQYSNGYYADPALHGNSVPSALIFMVNAVTTLVSGVYKASASGMHTFDLTTGTYADLSAVAPSSGRAYITIEEYEVV